MKEIAIIGAGPAGLMAAIFASNNGNKVTVFEQMSSAGLKLLVTGNGRCNISNVSVNGSNYHGNNPKFVESVFARFSSADTKDFFIRNGIDIIEGDKGKLYPSTEKATDVLDLLLSLVQKQACTVNYKSSVENIVLYKNQYKVEYKVAGLFEETTFDGIIIAAGGKSYQMLGANGSGYELATALGHNIIRPIPSSVPIVSRDPICLSIKGVTLFVEVTLSHLGKRIVKKNENMIFTHYGASGPAILSISREISLLLNRKRASTSDLQLTIDFVVDKNQDLITKLLKERTTESPERMFSNQFYDICAKSLANQLLIKCNIDPKQTGNLSIKNIQKLSGLLKRYQLRIDGLLDWEHAQFTAGGVDTKEIDSKTMESKISPGLFFAGEVVDIDGDSGGYNLQWAWSSGALAGSSI